MWFFASIAVFFGGAIAFFNWATVFTSTPEKNVSPAPLLGGVLIAVGFLGFEVTRPYWWLAVLIDFGTLGIILALVFFLAQICFSGRRRIGHSYRGVDGDRTVEIDLFDNGDAAITVRFDPPRRSDDERTFTNTLCLSGKWNAEGDGFIVSNYGDGRRLRIEPHAEMYTLIETLPASHDLGMSGLHGVVVTKHSDPMQDDD